MLQIIFAVGFKDIFEYISDNIHLKRKSLNTRHTSFQYNKNIKKCIQDGIAYKENISLYTFAVKYFLLYNFYYTPQCVIYII